MSSRASFQAQVPGFIEDYFGSAAVRAEHPVIVQAFRPGIGWKRHPPKRVSVSWLRKMRRNHFTWVSVRCQGRVADFTIAEVVRHAERPLLGGTVI